MSAATGEKNVREQCQMRRMLDVKVDIENKSIPNPRAQVNVERVAANIAANNGSFLSLKQG